MITEEIRKIDEKIHKMDPLDVTTIDAIDWIGTTLRICQKHGFNEEDTLEITREIGYILLEVAPPEELFDQLQKRTNLTSSSIKILLEEINREIFGKIVEGYSVLEEITATELRKIAEEEKAQQAQNHLLVVPIKEKEGGSAQAGWVSPASQKVADQYREPID